METTWRDFTGELRYNGVKHIVYKGVSDVHEFWETETGDLFIIRNLSETHWFCIHDGKTIGDNDALIEAKKTRPAVIFVNLGDITPEGLAKKLLENENIKVFFDTTKRFESKKKNSKRMTLVDVEDDEYGN